MEKNELVTKIEENLEKIRQRKERLEEPNGTPSMYFMTGFEASVVAYLTDHLEDIDFFNKCSRSLSPRIRMIAEAMLGIENEYADYHILSAAEKVLNGRLEKYST